MMSMYKILKMRAERMKRGWSQQCLGYLAKVGASDISRIETGQTKPYPVQAERIAKVLGLQPTELQEPAA
jgi:ribosome-binding protein aMBF1 (putative translation factor)